MLCTIGKRQWLSRMRSSVPDYDVIVLGAGLGGLAAASILALRGKRVLVLERHSIPGGFATNFARKGFTFDVSLHSFDGVRAGTSSFDIVAACGVADRVEFLPHRKLYRILAHDVDLSVYHGDLARYREQLSQLYPDERDGLCRMFEEAERMFRHVGRFICTSMPFTLKMLSMPFLFHRILRYEHSTVDQFFSRFIKDSRLKELLSVQWSYYGLPPDRLAFPYFSYPFIDYLKHGGYSIRGGSQALSNAMVDVIREHGGDVLLTTPVTKLVFKGGRAPVVVARKLGAVSAGAVISNLSPYSIVNLAEEGSFPQRFLDRLKRLRVSISGLQVYLGLDCPLPDLGVDPDEYIIFVGNQASLRSQYESMAVNDVESGKTAFSINLFSNVDPSMAPAGKSTLGLFSLVGGQYWLDLPYAEYRRRKKAVTEFLLQRADQVIPNLSRHIEVCETGTPRTMTRYTANPAGCFYGFEQSLDQSGLLRRFPQRYPVKGLYQVGAWTFPGGGYIATLMSAKFLTDRYF
jgi:prolycopene isomerase